MIEKLRCKLNKPNTSGMFHDSRADSKIFMQVFNLMHDKVNELIDENRHLKEKVDHHEKLNQKSFEAIYNRI